MIGWLVAAQIAVVAQAPAVAATCAPIEITVAARVQGTTAPVIAPPGGAFQLLRATTTSRSEPDGTGAPFSITEATFVVATHQAGRVTVPPLSVSAGARHGASSAMTIAVRDEGEEAEPMVLVRATLDDGGRRATVDSLYVGQQVDYVLDVQLNEAARRRMRRNPTFFPPDMPAVLAYDVEPPRTVGRRGPQCFETLSYRRALFPLFPGRTAIPPASLTYALPVSISFFSREETHELRTDSVAIVAIEPPAAGRPAGYLGAIGTLRASARVSDTSARMGDPVVVTLRVEGSGNVKLLPRPPLQVDWAAVANGPERVEVDTAHARVSGAKEFDWLLTPRRAGRVSVGAIGYPYFDPARASYDVTTTAPLAIDVAAAALASADTAVTARLPVRTVLREERREPLPAHPAYWALLALAPLPATLRRARRVRRQRHDGLTPARRLERLAASASPVLARDLRRAFLDALRERVPSLVSVTARTPLARQLRRAGVTDATAEAAEQLVDALDTAAFSGSGTLDADRTADSLRLAREIDTQAVRRPRHTPAGGALVLLALLGVGVAVALPDGAQRTFAEGVTAYTSGNLAVAERQFARVATRAPRAVDAWANLGAAAWERGDTARAVAAWQRALRLDPLEAEVRERLGAVHAGGSLASPGYVPPVPVDALASLALALWVASWLVLALPPARRPSVARPLAGGAIAVAVVALAGALELRDRLDPRDLGVLRESSHLLEGPATGEGTEALGSVGEVGRLGVREGAWVRVTIDDARAGWVPATAVMRLEDAASN